FPAFWDRVASLVDAGRLVAPLEVLHETKRRSDALHKWLSQRKAMFIDIDEAIQARQSAIMAAYPRLIDQRSSHFAADPWVISLAVERGLVLVTQERPTGKVLRPNIPDVCDDEAFKTPCINVLDLIRRENWVFAS